MPSIAPIAALLSCCLLAAAPLAAQPTGATQGTDTVSFFGEMVSIVVPLAFIILALLVVLRLARRRYGVGPKDAPLSIVQVLPVGPRERIVLLRTRTGRLFAVGVGGASVRLLTDLDPAEWVEAAASAPDAERAKFIGWPLTRRDPSRPTD